jgi:transcriptional regulator with XRE-family HTH domain
VTAGKASDPTRTPNQLLRGARLEQAWTQPEAARELAKLSRSHVTRQMISDWERGLTPSLPNQRLLAQLYGRSRDQLGFPVVDQPPRPLLAGRNLAQQEDADTERRQFLAWMATVAGATVLDVERLAALSQHATPHGLDVRYLNDMDSLGSRLMADWYTHSPQSLLPAASGHLVALRGLLPGPPALAASLASVTGRAALLVGHALLKLERRGDAYAQFSLAERLARDAGDGTLLALVLAIRSGMYSPISLGHRQGNTDRAIALLDEAAVAGAQAPGRVRVLVFARRAEERAAVQDEIHALRDMATAESSLSLSDDETFFGPRNDAEVGAIRGTCEALLGRNREAVGTLQQTADRMDPSLVAWRSAVLADQGAAPAPLGHVDEACDKLSRALELARTATANDHMQRIAGVRQVHLARFSGDQAVRRLDDELGHDSAGYLAK